MTSNPFEIYSNPYPVYVRPVFSVSGDRVQKLLEEARRKRRLEELHQLAAERTARHQEQVAVREAQERAREQERQTLDWIVKNTELSPVRRAIADFCLKRRCQFFLPSELYRNSKAVRNAVDFQIDQERKVLSFADTGWLHTRTIFVKQEASFETIVSPALVIKDHCDELVRMGIATVEGNRFGLAGDKTKPHGLTIVGCICQAWR